MVVNKDIREQAGVEQGDEVEVVMQIDTEPRTVVVPRARERRHPHSLEVRERLLLESLQLV